MGAISKVAEARTITPAQSGAITFRDERGDIIRITSDDVRMHICPQADAKEVAYFLELCRSQRLNPFANEAYLVKYKGAPAQMMVAHKVLVKRAERHDQYDGMQHGVIVRSGDRYEHREGCAYPGEQLVGGWCKVYRKDRRTPIYVERSLSSMTKGQSTWKAMPDVMIDKCAQAAALREAFPEDFAGAYISEEMGSIPAQDVAVEQDATPPESATRLTAQPTPEERDTMRAWTAQLADYGYNADEVKRYIWQLYRDGGIGAARSWVRGELDGASRPASDADVAVEAEPVEAIPDELADYDDAS